MPNEMNSSMDGWDAPDWTLSTCRRCDRVDSPGQTIKPRTPFVLIGSDSQCEICLDEPQLPPVAYLVCNFARAVEVWPTAAIAFPRWGVMRSGDDLVVGGSRIRIDHPSLSGGTTDKPTPPGLDVSFRWNGVTRTCLLKRAVTIMGSGQPSVLRLQGQQLLPCDHAIVVQDGQLWLINLRPSLCRPGGLADAAVRSDDAAIPIGSQLESRDSASRLIHLSKSTDMARIGGVTIATGAGLACDHRGISLQSKVGRDTMTRNAGDRLMQKVESDQLSDRLTNRLVDLHRKQRSSRRREIFGRLLTRAGVVGSAAASLIASATLQSRLHD